MNQDTEITQKPLSTFYDVVNFRFLFYTLKFSSVRAIINKVFLKIIDKATNFDAKKTNRTSWKIEENGIRLFYYILVVDKKCKK